MTAGTAVRAPQTHRRQGRLARACVRPDGGLDRDLASSLVDQIAVAAHRRRAGGARVQRRGRCGPGTAGAGGAPRRPAQPAGRRQRGPGHPRAHLSAGLRPPRPGLRPGAADARRRRRPHAIPQRAAHVRPAARAGRGAGRQRERHRRHRRAAVRRQRPPGCAGRQHAARRGAGPAVRRRRALPRATVSRRCRP